MADDGSVKPGHGEPKKTCCQKFKGCLTLAPEGATPVNYKVMGLCVLALFSSSFTITFLFPFLPDMVLSFGYAEEQKGYYAGIIASSMFAGRAAGSYFWGWLSDRKGRRPILMITILGNGIFALAFGFTRTLTQAIVFRFLTGLCNGSVGTAKTILYEISDNTNQAVGMSALAFAWGGGIIVGPAIGGYLASPVRKYPTIFSPDGFLATYPFVLPSIVSFIISLIAVSFLFWKLPETLKTRKTSEEIEVDEKNIDVTEKLIGSEAEVKVVEIDQSNLDKSETLSHRNTDFQRFLSLESLNCDTRLVPYMSQEDISLEHKKNLSAEKVPNVTSITTSGSALHENSKDYKPEKIIKQQTAEHKVNMATIHVNNGNHDNNLNAKKSVSSKTEPLSCCAKISSGMKNSALVTLLGEPDVRHSVVLYTVFSFAVIGYEEIFTVWASTKPSFDGLGFDTDAIGTVLLTSAIPLFCLQIFIFPLLAKHFGLIKTFYSCGGLVMVLVLATPMLHLIHDKLVWLWVCLMISQMPQRIAVNCAFGATSLFINNSVSPENAGAVNGIAMTVTAIARTLAPTVGGSVFAWSISYGTNYIGPPFDVNLAFFLFSAVYCFSSIYCVVFIPERLNRQSKKT